MSFEPFQPVVAQWIAKIRLGVTKKAERFGKDAEEGMKFLSGTCAWLYGEDRKTDRHFRQLFEDDEADAEIPAPKFQMSTNKAAELVQLFGPHLYHRNPIRQVNPRMQPLPDPGVLQMLMGDPVYGPQLQMLGAHSEQSRVVDKTRAALLENYLNYTPSALDLKTEARWAIDEALVKGMGVLFSEVYVAPGRTGRLVGSFYDSVDNLIIDPDATGLRNAKWVARRRIQPVWEAERRFNLKAGTLRATHESYNRQAEVNSEEVGDYMRKTGQTCDLITYWEVFSKTGVGNRLTGVTNVASPLIDSFGDFAWVVVAEGIPFPLNVQPEILDNPDPNAAMQQLARMLAWPTPYWADDDWPFTPIYFHTLPGDVWPMSHLAPAMGELKFLNWAYSYCAGKLRITSRDFLAILEEAGEDVRDAIVHGADYEVIKLKGSNGKSLDQMVQFLSHPGFNLDLYKMIEIIAEQFDKRTGLTELLYGQTGVQLRSAAEAQAKQDSANIRPDEMANKVEDAMSLVARHEALAARWHLTGKDVRAVMGPVGSAMWDLFMVPSDPGEILWQLEYRIEAGSAKKPNKDRDRANLTDAMQNLMPFFQNLAISQGFVDPFNALLTAYGKAVDMDVEGMILPVPQPVGPAPPGQPPAGGGPPQQPPAAAPPAAPPGQAA